MDKSRFDWVFLNVGLPKLTLITYGGQDKAIPSTNYNTNMLFLTFKFDCENSIVYQEPTKFATACQPHSTTWKKNTIQGSSFPPLSMTGLAIINEEIFMWGGLDLNCDTVSAELYLFYGLRYTIKYLILCKIFIFLKFYINFNLKLV